MKLTNYGRKVLSRATALAAMLVMVTGGIMTAFDKASWILLGQQAFNLLYIAFLMPVSFAIMAHIAFAEYDRQHGSSIQDFRRG